jgi:hypothetical protein
MQTSFNWTMMTYHVFYGVMTMLIVFLAVFGKASLNWIKARMHLRGKTID